MRWPSRRAPRPRLPASTETAPERSLPGSRRRREGDVGRGFVGLFGPVRAAGRLFRHVSPSVVGVLLSGRRILYIFRMLRRFRSGPRNAEGRVPAQPSTLLGSGEALEGAPNEVRVNAANIAESREPVKCAFLRQERRALACQASRYLQVPVQGRQQGAARRHHQRS